MHAIVVRTEIHDQVEAQRAVEAEIMPMLRNAPGFVAAYFIALEGGEGLSVHVFDSEEQARNAAPPADKTAPGVTRKALHYGSVIGAV